ncbi:MAG: isopeptide-forming domain-containing fimbrial protein [Aeromicrobium erythreum]
MTALVAGLLAVVPMVPAAAAQSMTLSASSDPVLVGEDVGYSLKASNTGDEDLYNLTFRVVLPQGVTYVSGSTRPSGLDDPTQVVNGDGSRTLIWSNVDDAARNGDVSLDFSARPDLSVYPVGSTIPATADVYANSDPRYVPRFTPSGTLLDRSTVTASTTSTTRVSAIALTKTEPSPEHELLRGVHDHPTTYTLKVRNNGSIPTDAVTVVDYLPAGLEFLGCGGVDNSPAGFEEYSGSGRLTGTPAVGASCATPTSVQTVDSNLPSGYPAGVYTKVTWDVGTLAGGASRTITYAAGIPMRENVMPTGAFTATANLTNNTGAPTREGASEKAYTNRSLATGTYTGPMSGNPTDKTVTSAASVTVTAEDVAVQKAVTPRTFDQGKIATYTLTVEGSEYTTATNVVMTDSMPNGLCPLDTSTNHEDTSAAECAPGSGLDPSGASYDSVTDLDADGFRIVFTPLTLAKNQVRTVTYKARMRPAYKGSTEPTSSGDSFVNKVALTGRTSKIPASESGTDPVTVNDASQASLGTDGPSLDKQISTQATPMSCASATYTDTIASDDARLTYRKGDRVCFRVRVDFSDATSTRAPRVTDFLPDGLTYETGSATATAANDVTFSTDESLGNPVFTIGDTVGSNRFVDPGSVFEVTLSGIVSSPGNGDVDVKGNLAKFRYLDQNGRSQSLRDQVDFSVAPPPTVGIDKTVDDADVVHGDVSTFSVKVTNSSDTDGIDANERAVDDVEVRDLLPGQYSCSDVSAIYAGGTCATVGGIATISWTITDALAPGASTTLTYKTTTPTTTAAGRTYTNTAGVRSFVAATNVGTNGRTTHYPKDNIDPSVATGLQDAPVAKDTAAVRLPAVTLAKTNQTDVTEAGNGASDAVAGEKITYTVTATVPARTTVYQGRVTDPMPSNVTLQSSSVVYRPDSGSGTTAALPSGVGYDAATGTLTLPATYTNTTATDQVFVLTLVARVAPGTATPGPRTNTASFATTDGPLGTAGTQSVTASSTVQVKAPIAKITKNASPSSAVGAGQDVTYTVTAQNTGPVPLHDAVVTDCLPAALTLDTATLPSGATSAQATASQCPSTAYTFITIPAGSIAPSASKPFTYTAKVSAAAAGGETYRNSAKLVGSSLDDGKNDNTTDTASTSTTFKDVSTTAATVGKTVSTSRARVGDTVTYTVTATFARDLNYYDAAVTDLLPTGVSPSSVSDVSVTCQRSTAPTSCSNSFSTLLGNGQTIGWGLGDLAADTATRTYTITYSAKVADVAANTTGATNTNAATVRWDSSNGTDPGSVTATWNRSAGPANAAFRVQQPDVRIAKSVDDTTPEPGQSFRYRLAVTNPQSGFTSDGFGVVVKDVVPTGVVVDESTISDSGSYDSGTRTITWNLSKVTVDTTTTLTYDAKLAASGTLDGSGLVNSAKVTRFESLPSGGRVYTGPTSTATVTPQLPKVSIAKSVVGGSTAEVGKDKTYKVTVTNTGKAPATIDVTDVLPRSWVYAGSATVGVGSATAQPMTPQDDGQDPSTLRWSAIGPVAPGDAVVITYTARPTKDATTNPGSGSSVDHVNTASVVAKDATGATASASGSYAGSPATAAAQINRADLTLEKKGDGTLVAGRSYSWKLTVGNDGPDAATGDIVVTDELPDELTGYSASGTGWSCSVGSTSVTCTHAGPLANGAKLPVVTVTGQVPSDLSTSTSITNTAKVSGDVFESVTDNNTATSTVAVTALADLAIDKKLSGSLVAGQDATWTIDVTNNGPSTARGPITVKDTLPSGTRFVSASGAGWDCDESDGTITCTSDDDLANGAAAPQVVVKASVPADRTAKVTNTATVSGTTPEPSTVAATGNDRDTAEDTPTRTALLTASKVVKGDTKLVAGATGTYVLGVANAGPSTATSVTITDELPSGLTYEGFRGTGWDCDEASGTVTCELDGALDPQDSSSVEIDVKVASDQTGEIVNTAKAVATEDRDGAEATDENTPDQDSDYTISKTHTGQAVAGRTFDYTVTVRNEGPSDSPGPLAVEDLLPEGMSFDSASGDGWTCDADGQDVSCERTGGLADGASTSFTLTVKVDSAAGPATLDNSVAVSGPQETDVSNNTDTDPTVVVDRADVSITKTAAVDSVDAGDDVTWTLAVANAGPSHADAVTVTDTMPAGLVVKSVIGQDWECDRQDGSFSCVLTTLAPGVAPPLTLVTTVGSGVAKGTTLKNTASVVTSTTGDDDADNSDSDSVDVTTHADLAITKTHTGTPVAGRSFAFTIGVENQGPSDAQVPLEVTDRLPVGMTYVGTPGPWSCTPGPVSDSGQEVECTLSSATALVAGQDAPDLVMTVDVAADTAGTKLVNTASVTSGTDDPDGSNDEATDDVTPTGVADLSITKSHTGTAKVGEDLSFTLDVHNDGPSEARDVTVEDTLPTGLTFVSASGDGWTCDDEDASCSLDEPLAPGADAPALTVVATVEPGAYPSVRNTATVATSSTDPESANDKDSDDVTVPALTDLRIDKKLVGDLRVGDRGTYTLTVTNDGPTADPGPVTVTDTLPAGLTYVSATGDGWTCLDGSGTITCVDLDGLAVDESSTITLTVDVGAKAYPSVVNRADVSTPSVQTDVDNDTSSVTSDVGGSSHLTIAKTLAEQQGREATWRLRVRNDGPTETTAPVVVTDRLPRGLEVLGATAPGWSCTTTKRTVSCTHDGVLAVGTSSDLEVRTRITAAAGETITNVASVSAGGLGTDTGDSDDAQVVSPSDGGLLPDTGGPALWLLLLGLLGLAGGAVTARRRRS